MSDMLNSPAGGCGSGNCACKSQAQARAGNAYFDDTDYGTPARHADVDVTLEIDGQSVTVPAVLTHAAMQRRCCACGSPEKPENYH